MSRHWYFPADLGGEENGLNDPGIEFFKSAGSLARETVQNSGDAHDGGAKPVLVRFHLRKLPRQEFPDVDELRVTFESARSSVRSACSPEQWAANGEAFFDDGLAMLAGDEIPVLQISDFNTTGLEGGEDQQMKGWYRLVRKQGTTAMHGAGGGTFGIGQRAPFAYSGLRTVFYGTMTRDGNSKFIGKSILCSFKDPAGELHRAVGFWGNSKLHGNGVNPLSSLADLSPVFQREAVGTDVYITGFRRKEWLCDVAISLVRNFFAALQHRHLVVQLVDDFTNEMLQLDDQTLVNHIEALGVKVEASEKTPSEKRELKGDLAATRYFLEALAHPHDGKVIEDVLKRLGPVSLFLHVSPDAPSRIAYMRRPRILVYERAQKSGLRGYAAVFICENPEGNKALASLEDPAHQKWDRQRAPDGGALLQELYEFIRKSLKAISGTQENEAQDVPDLGKYLPEDDSDGAETALGGTRVTAKTAKAESGKVKGASVRAHVTSLTRSTARTMSEDEGPAGGTDEGATGAPAGHGATVTDNDSSGGELAGEGSGESGGDRKAPRALREVDIDYRAFQDAALDGCVTLVVWSKRDGIADLAVSAAGVSGVVGISIIEAENESHTAVPFEKSLLRGVVFTANERRRLVLRLDHPGKVALSVGVR